MVQFFVQNLQFLGRDWNFVIAGNVIYLLGVDMISGTPVIDIKPYIPQYDSPWNLKTSLSDTESMSANQGAQECCADDPPACLAEKSVVLNLPSVEVNERGDSEAENVSSAITSDHRSHSSENTTELEVSVASWIINSPQPTLSVIFTARADNQLKQFDSTSPDVNFKLRHLANASELRSALTAVLRSDPRSVYRRNHCQDQLYYVTVDIAHVTSWFDFDIVEVLKVQSVFMLQKENENM